MKTATKAKVLFIINPNAGKRNTRRLLRELKPFQSVIQVKQTEYPRHAYEIAKSELENFETFVAVGGDGTINEVASALVGTDKRLAIFPAGSGNGFARELGFRKNIAVLFDAIEKGNTIKTDVIQLNGHSCINMAGIGFDSAVAHRFAKGQRRGFWSYVKSTLETFRKFRPIKASVQIDGQTIKGRFFMISIANTRQFGSNALISPQSTPTDRKYEMVLVSPIPIWKIPDFVIRLFNGSLKPSKYVQFVTCKNETILTTSKKKFHIDGEPLKLKSPVKIQINAGKLNVIDTGKSTFN